MKARVAIRCVLVAAAVLLTAVQTGPVSGAPSDDEIRDRILTALDRDPAWSEAGIRVEVVDGVATLLGSVDVLAEAREVENAIGRIPGVRDVRNELDVATRGRGDDGIRFEIQNRFERNVNIPGTVTVKVERGVVTLGGSVESPPARLFARDEAAAVEGVVRVVDDIRMPAEPDEIVRDRVHKVLEPRRAALKGITGEIDADVADGTVVLTGRVPLLTQKRAAEKLVLAVPGVRRVINGITVEPGFEPTRTEEGAD